MWTSGKRNKVCWVAMKRGRGQLWRWTKSIAWVKRTGTEGSPKQVCSVANSLPTRISIPNYSMQRKRHTHRLRRRSQLNSTLTLGEAIESLPKKVRQIVRKGLYSNLNVQISTESKMLICLDPLNLRWRMTSWLIANFIRQASVALAVARFKCFQLPRHPLSLPDWYLQTIILHLERRNSSHSWL